MKVLELLWLPKEQSECSLFDIKYQGEILNITLKTDKMVKEGTVFFTLIERSSQQVLKFPVNEYGETDILSIDISIDNYINYLTTGIWDAYLQIEKEGTISKFRVKNKLTESIELPPFYLTNSNISLVPYSTIKGNLSFKCEESKAILKIENFSLEENGSLMLSGYFLVPSWSVEKSKDVRKQLILRSGNNELNMDIHNVARQDVSTFFGRTDNKYDWTGFDIHLDFSKNSYELLDEKSTDLHIKMTFKNQEMILPIVISPAIDFNKTAVFQSSDGIKNIYINIDEESHRIALLVTKENLQAEVDAIYSENGEITLLGSVISRDKAKRVSHNNTDIVVKERQSGEEYHFGVEIYQSCFTHTFKVKELLEKEIFTAGVWDLYLLIEGQMYRLVTRLDGIMNKQKLVSIPQQMFSNKEGKILSIKPYYTLHEEVSIFSRDSLAVKSIEKVAIEKGILSIVGKLNIQPPNLDFPTTTIGKLTIKGKFGKVYDFPATWQTEKTGKTNLEFQFIATVDLINQGLTELSDSLLKDINFDLIQCEIFHELGIIPFTMNIDPAKVIVTLEDRLRQSSKYKGLLTKWGLRFYKACNKILPIKKKNVVFQSFHGKSYSCSPKAIYEEMLEQKRNIKPIWVLNNLKQEVPGNAILVRPHSLKYYYYMATSKYFVNNGNFPDFYEKREKTVHLQTWHGTPLKKLGFDIDPNSPSYAENTSPQICRRNARWDYLIGPNEYTSTILKRAFKFEKQMLDVGYPRNDIFYKPNLEGKAAQIKERLNIPTNKKVILYAPTWRDYDFHNGNQHKPYEFKFNLNSFKEQFGEEYVLLLRLHYRDATRIKIEEFEDFIYNVSSYDDIQELYLISDLLITDYSSVMFDFANINRPIIFFTYDLSRYGSQVRGFYMDFQTEAPGPIVLNEQQLFHAIENVNKVEKLYNQRYKSFREKFCHLEDGKASKRTVEALFKNK
ncbi:CDP-glycerol glycerophosphotransferase family protein [Peribacillus frigoritolerans]|jgi:CDP-glycerol glycerophosphotransferase|uniref:CDP-glycerol glycerophosphotransferase family protein n=1 Tax=Peribacillus frigoritolerans TaxID=450367 RepID=UPI0039A203B0